MRTVSVSKDLDSLRVLWEGYALAHPRRAVFTAWTLGDSPALADELAAMVAAGSKRATARLLRDFVDHDEPLPQTGDHAVVMGGDSIPRCVIRVVHVDVKQIRSVDEQFIQNAGEGDGSAAWWLTAMMRYFKRQGAREGFAIDDRTEVVLIDFIVVWPPKLADAFADAPSCQEEEVT